MRMAVGMAGMISKGGEKVSRARKQSNELCASAKFNSYMSEVNASEGWPFVAPTDLNLPSSCLRKLLLKGRVPSSGLLGRGKGRGTDPTWSKVIRPSPSMSISTVNVVVCAFTNCNFQDTTVVNAQRYNGLGLKAPMMIRLSTGLEAKSAAGASAIDKSNTPSPRV